MKQLSANYRSILISYSDYLHTKVLGLLYFVVAAQDYLAIWPPKDSATSASVSALIVGDFVCSLLPFFVSILYHTFMPHHSGEKTYKQLLQLDVFGVWWCCTLGPISNVYTGLYHTTWLMVAYFAIYWCFSSYVLFYLMVIDCKKKRVGALTAQFFVRIFIHVLRLSPLSSSSTAAVKFYLVMDAVSATGAVINALHVPERWFPGKLDYVLNGHTLMHVAAIVSLMVARQGFLCDMAWLNDIGTHPGHLS